MHEYFPDSMCGPLRHAALELLQQCEALVEGAHGRRVVP
jgi:hypothetical protein